MGNKRRITRPYLFLQLSGGFVTVDSRRHAEVQNDQLGHKCRSDLNRFLPALRQPNLASEVLKFNSQRLSPIVMIVDNKNSERLGLFHQFIRFRRSTTGNGSG
jgi:hypothetical protein